MIEEAMKRERRDRRRFRRTRRLHRPTIYRENGIWLITEFRRPNEWWTHTLDDWMAMR
jgi:hypothetical protein